MSQKAFEMLENFVGDIMTRMKFPGMSIGIAINGKNVYLEGYGARDLEKNLPMTPDTLFGIGSISKTFGSLAIMQLYEKSKIDLEDPVHKYVNFKLGEKDNPIKIRHVLTHTTGYPELWAIHSLAFRVTGGIDALPPMTSWKDYLNYINGASNEKFAEPGEVYSYNNDMFALVIPIVEKVTGMPYHLYIKENILQPLKMNNSLYLKEEFEKNENRITGYMSLDGKMVPCPLPFNQFTFAGGGLISSVREMLQYLNGLMDIHHGEKMDIMKKETLDMMWTPRIRIQDDENESEENYGYGWHVENDFFGQTLISHGGDFHVSGGEIAMIPEKKMAVVIGLNKQPGPIAQMMARAILAVLLGKEMKEALPLLNQLEKFQLLTGKYQSYRGILKAEITMESGMLIVKAHLPKMMGGTVSFPLIPKNLEKLQFTVPVLGGQNIKVLKINEKTKDVALMVDRYILHKK